MSEFDISPAEATYWWRKNDPTGALLNTLMILFIIVPILLVWKQLFGYSAIVFAFMVPYGLFLRHLAVRAVRNHLANHPEAREALEQDGVIRFRIS